jgi:hypothetical protein
VYCLDAWLKGAPLEVATAELGMRRSLGRDWPTITAAVYEALGGRSELKSLLITRLVHRLRWWAKSHIWVDDHRDRFLLDVYSGDVRGDEARYGAYGNSPYGDPYFSELRLPAVEALSGRIRQSVPDGDVLLGQIEGTWLCAPKAFRSVEKLILRIGSIESPGGVAQDRPILQCADTYPSTQLCHEWYGAFVSSLKGWLAGDSSARADLGGITPAKHWLVRLLHHKLELYERHCNFGSLVGARPAGRSGNKALDPLPEWMHEPA